MSSSSALSHPSFATSDATLPYLAMSKYGSTPYPGLASLLDAGLPSTTNVFHNEQSYILSTSSSPTSLCSSPSAAMFRPSPTRGHRR